MAFFDFDRRIQTLLIAGAMASLTACGGSTHLDGAADTTGDGRPDAVDAAADTPLDVADDDFGPVDPAPDVLDGSAVCPDPDTWQISLVQEATTWPIMTLRISLNVDDAFIHDSEPLFSVEKKSIVDTRMVTASTYDIDYRWEGALEHEYWDWDRLNVSWRVVCSDEFGSHERTLMQSQILCVDGGYLWFAWGSDPDSCMVVDCVPDSMDPGETTATSSEAPLERGVLHTRLRAFPNGEGTVKLVAAATGTAAPAASHAWIASGGELITDGERALWTPPSSPGVHTVQVTTTSGNALSVDVYRKIVDE